MQEAINKLREKIQNKNFDLTENEKIMLRELPFLAKEYVAAWAQDENLWHQYQFIVEFFELEYMEDLSYEEKKVVIKNTIFGLSKYHNDVSFDDLIVILNYFNINSDDADKIKKEFLDFVISDEFDVSNNAINGSTIMVLIDNNLKDKIAKIKEIDSFRLKKEEYERYLTYCQDNGLQPLFGVVDTEELQYNIDNFLKIKPIIADNLFAIYNDYYNVINGDEKSQELFLDTLKAIPEPIIFKDFYKQASNLLYWNNELFEKVSKILCSKHYPINATTGIEDYSDRIRVLDDYCFNNDNLDNDILIDNITYFSEKKYFDRFLETGNLCVLLNPIYKSFIPDHIDEIVEKFRNNPKEQKYLRNNLKGVNNYQLLELLAKEGYVKEISFNDNEPTTEEDFNSVRNMITKYNVEPILQGDHTFSPKLSELLIDCGYISYLITNILNYGSANLVDFINNHIEAMQKLINDNPSYILQLLNKNPEIMLQTDLMKDFVDFPDEVLSQVVEKMSTNENIENIPKEYIEKYYNLFVDRISDLYNINKKKMDLIKESLGPSIILYICDDSIKSFLKLSFKDLEKIMAIFKTSPITISDLESNYTSLKEYAFKSDCPDDAEIFSNIMTAIENNNAYLLSKYHNKLMEVMNETLFERLNKKYKLKEMGFTPDNYYKIIDIALGKVNIPEKRDKYINLLYEICNYYVETKRTEHANVKNMPEELELSYTADPKMLEEKIVKHIIKSGNMGVLAIAKDEFINAGFDGDVFDEVLALIRGIRDAKDISLDAKKQIGKVKTVIYRILEKEGLVEDYKNILMENGSVDKIYNTDGLKQIDMVKILKELNIKLVKELINNPYLYEQLLEFFQKRKPHLLPESTNKLLSNTNMSFEPKTISQLINYFQEICKEETKKEIKRKEKKLEKIVKSIESSSSKDAIDKLSRERLVLEQEIKELEDGKIPEIKIAAALADADSFFAISSVYSLILTVEDARLIKRNPPSNAATRKIKNNERLKEAVELTKLLFTRDEITIPPSNDIIELENGKSLRVTAGNFTDPANLTHGERTGACMRIGGVGEDLFNYALKNKNGFHVKFTDPKTNEYISRITGFRRGNTVFLNELRNSKSENYDDEDLINALKLYANNLIEASKDSSFPIENVIASNDQALYEEPTVDLHIGDINQSSEYVYNNIKPSACVVLATSAKDSQFAPLNLTINDLPIYQPIRREKRVITTKKELSDYVNRIESVKAILNGADYQTLTYYYHNEEFLYAVANDEWYIFVDINGVIHKNCLSTDKRAQEEFLNELERVEDKDYEMKEDEEKWNLK